VAEAQAVIAGGHTIQDKEPKIGLAVAGLAHPDRLLTKSDARPGDVLILTKPLGTGCITTAAKNDKATPVDVNEAVEWMMTLNRHASEAAAVCGARTATDVTGFGLLGHATEIAELSNVTLYFHADQIPLLSSAMTYASMWTFPGGSSANREAYENGVRFEGDISEERRMLFFDAQTSGGLLIALPTGQQETFAAEMKARGASWWVIGRVGDRDGATNIVITR
jgi:selenide,water dikinase